MTIIGITGPTGSGKTTALEVLGRRGFETIDCDRLYDALLERDQGLRQALADAFGPVFLPDGGLDRQALAARVFGDSRELETLNAIVYPAVGAAVEQKIRQCSRPGVAIDAINLIESGLCDMCRRTVAVTAPPEVRVRRIMARDHIPEDYARLRVQAQKDEEFYRTHCTDVLVNDCADAAAFERRAYRALETILKEEQA